MGPPRADWSAQLAPSSTVRKGHASSLRHMSAPPLLDPSLLAAAAARRRHLAPRMWPHQRRPSRPPRAECARALLLVGSAPELAHRRANKPPRLSTRETCSWRLSVTPLLPCVARCASREAMLARFLRRGCQTRGDPESCHAFSATSAIAGAVTAGSRRQLAGGIRVPGRPVMGRAPM